MCPSRSAVRLLAALAIVAVAVVGAASPASAHADLVGSTPAPGAVLDESPPSIDLEFTEPVTVASGAIRVFDTDGARADGGTIEVDDRVASLALPVLDDGSYAVTWRVTSYDGHPVSGAFTFQVGSGPGPGATSREVTGLAEALLAEQGGDRVVGVVYGVARWLTFGGLALLLGGVVFALHWPGARRLRGARRVVRVGWAATAIATVVSLVVYGPYVAGLGLGDVLSSDLLGDTLAERQGQVWVARLVGLAGAAVLLSVLVGRRRPVGAEGGAVDATSGADRPLPAWWLPVGIPLALLLAATPGLAGHASSGRWSDAAVVVDTLHVLAMSVWFGGIVVLAVGALGRESVVSTGALARFSRIALGSMVVIVATGIFQSVRQVGGFEALRDTEFGRILVVKVVLVAGIVVVAAFSREIVLRRSARAWLADPDHRPAGEPPPEEPTVAETAAEQTRLRRSVLAEVGLGLAVLAATALLVNSPPATSVAATSGGAIGVTMNADTVSVDVTVTPGAAGRNDVHVDTFTPEGTPLDVRELTVTFALPARDLAAIDVPLRRLGPGHFYSPGFQIPFPGDWRIVAKPTVSDFEQPTLEAGIEIR